MRMTVHGDLKAGEKAEVLREAYKKHATELLAIEEAQQKLVSVMLSIFGAGASFLAAMKTTLRWGPRIGLIFVAAAIVAITLAYGVKRKNARSSVRALLEKCEEALGFYESGAYLPTGALYTRMEYAGKGDWLSILSILAVGAAGAGFVTLLVTL